MSYLKLCNDFSNPCLRITVVTEEPVFILLVSDKTFRGLSVLDKIDLNL